MGNRAIVIFEDEKKTETSAAVYLHWNGRADSVYPFLDELLRRKTRSEDISYAAARFVNLVGDYFDFNGQTKTIQPTHLSLGIFNGPVKFKCRPKQKCKALIEFDHGDNGIYLVCILPKGGCRVRRFTSDVDESPIEWTKKEVETERKAIEDGYGDITGFFLKSRPVMREY